MSKKKFKMPKLSEQEIAELTQACQMAFADPAADEFFEEVMAEARRLEKLWPARGISKGRPGKQSLTE